MRAVVDMGRSGRVIGWEREVEEVESIVVRCTRGAHDYSSQEINAILVHAYEDRIWETFLEDSPLLNDLLVGLTGWCDDAISTVLFVVIVGVEVVVVRVV